MANVSISVSKASVYKEVGKTASYSGAKAGDVAAYDRIFATEADELMFERFWNEACNNATDLFKPFLVGMPIQSDISDGSTTISNYTATLDISSAFDSNLTESINSSLFSFFTNYIVSEWFRFGNKADAPVYAAEAAAMLKDVKSKIYYRKKPTRTPVKTTTS